MPSLTKDRHTALAEAIMELCEPIMQTAKEGKIHASSRLHRTWFEAWEECVSALFTAIHTMDRERNLLSAICDEAVSIQAKRRAEAEDRAADLQSRLDAANRKVQRLENHVSTLKLEMEPELNFASA